MVNWNKKNTLFVLSLLVLFHHCSGTRSVLKEEETAGEQNKYALYSRGIMEMTGRRPENAIPYFKKAYELDPDPEIAQEISHCYLQMNDYSNAAAALSDSIQRHPDDPSLRFGLADIYLLTKESDRAVEAMDHIIMNDPTNTEALFKIGAIYQDEHNYHRAMEYYRKVLEIKPYHTDALVNLGHIHFLFGEMRRAGECFKKVLELDQDDIESTFIYAYLLKLTGEYGSALNLYRSVRERLPDSGMLHRHMAETYYLLQDKAKCAEQLALILDEKESSGSEETALYQAMREELNGNRGKAVELFLAVLAGNTNELAAQTGLYRIHLRSGNFTQMKQSVLRLGRICYANENYGEALKYFNQYKKMAPGDIPIYVYLSILYDAQEKTDPAVRELREGLKIKNDDITLNYYLGILLGKKEDHAGAVRQFQKVLRLDRRHLLSYLHLNTIYHSMDENKKSVDIIKKGLKELPGEPDLYLYLGMTYNMMNQYTNTIPVLEKGLALAAGDAVMYYTLAHAYDQIRDKTKAAEVLKEGLKAVPENPELCNYLAYLYSEMDMNLEDARTLIQTALRSDRENYAYLDTAAWIYYRLNDLPRAARFLERARKNMEKQDRHDPVIFEHLSEVYLRMKDHEKAEEYRARIKKQDGIRP